MPTLKRPVTERLYWLLCLLAAASATQGLRSAKTLAELADELYDEYRKRVDP